MIACPNTNSAEWKELVERVGELKAYSLYIKNGYTVPSDPSSIDPLDSIESADEEIALQFKKITDIRKHILQSLKTKYAIFKDSDNEKFIEELKKLIKEFEESDITQSMFLFARNAEAMLNSLSSRIDKEKGNLELLKTMEGFAGTYELIGPITDFIARTYPKKKWLRDKMSSLEAKMKDFHTDYVEYGRVALTNRLAAESTIVRSQYKERYQREFRRNNPGAGKPAEIAYVEGLLNSNREKIAAEEKAYIRKLLETAPKDISGITASLVDPRGINDHLIQLAVTLLDKADYRAKEDFIKVKLEAGEKWEEFIKPGFITNQRELYEDIIEKIDGKETQYYVRPMYSHYYASLAEMRKTAREAGEEEGKKIRMAWKQKHLLNPFKDWEDISNIKPEYRNSQWERLKADSRKADMYDFLMKLNKESDKMVKGNARLGYKLPAMTKKDSELLTDKKWLDAGKQKLRDTFKLQKDDYQYGDTILPEDDLIRVLANEKGEALNKIGVPFRANIPVEDQSYDLMGMALSNHFVSLNYKHKSEIQNELEIMKDLFAERQVKATKGLSGKGVVQVIKSLGAEPDELREIMIPGASSKSYELLTSILEDRLYGKSNVEAGTVLGLSIDKLSGLAIAASANNMLIANYMGALSNTLAGKINNFISGFSGKHFSNSDLGAAEIKYGKDLAAIITDIGSFNPKAKTNLLLEKFLDSSMDFSGFANDLTQDTKMKRILSMKTLHGFNTVAEHWIQSTLMYAVLNNVKIKNKEGKYIDLSGKEVNREQAMSADEAYEIVDDQLKWKEGLVPEGFTRFSPNFEFYVNRKVKDIVADLQGNYDANNKAMVQRYWYGRLGFFLRKWIVRGTLRRWRGLEHATKDVESLDPHQRFYSEAGQEYKEGTYVSAIRFLTGLVKHGKQLKLEVLSQDWNSLTDMEKANIKAAVTEQAILWSTLFASSLLYGLAKGADDEDKDGLYTLAYLSRRQYGELMFYLPINPSEMTRILRTPSATITVLETSTKLGEQVLEDLVNWDLEEYEKGKNRGESKTLTLTTNLLSPIHKNILNKDVRESFEFLINH
jgi:hypothetical protein